MGVKDAIDLLQGHYIVSVSRDLTLPAQPGGLEAYAVSVEKIIYNFSLYCNGNKDYIPFMLINTDTDPLDSV